MIYLDDDFMKMDGILLPGLFKSLEVNTDATVDEQEVEGNSKKPKQATGYEDAKITIELSVMDSENQTKEEKLRILQNLFRMPGQEKPQVHNFISEHTAIRGITQVIVKNMTSKETNKKDEITVSLELWEYVEITIQATKKGSSKKKQEMQEAGTGLSEDYKSYMASDRGNAPKNNSKTDMSPAVDVAANLLKSLKK